MVALMSKVGKGGTVELPPELSRQFGIKEGSYIKAEAREDGILIRLVEMPEVEIYTPERKAEFFLNNAVDAESYAEALTMVRKMGLNPDEIDHLKPPEA